MTCSSCGSSANPVRRCGAFVLWSSSVGVVQHPCSSSWCIRLLVPCLSELCGILVCHSGAFILGFLLFWSESDGVLVRRRGVFVFWFLVFPSCAASLCVVVVHSSRGSSHYDRNHTVYFSSSWCIRLVVPRLVVPRLSELCGILVCRCGAFILGFLVFLSESYGVLVRRRGAFVLWFLAFRICAASLCRCGAFIQGSLVFRSESYGVPCGILVCCHGALIW